MSYKEFPRTRQEAETLDLITDLKSIDSQIQALSQSVSGLGDEISSRANREMEKAGDKAIAALSDKIAGIASRVAEDAAAAERHHAFAKAAFISVCSAIFLGVFFTTAGYKIGEYSAKKKIDEAESKATASEAKAKEEMENLRKSAGWLGTTEGKLAKSFSDLGSINIVATCKHENLEIQTAKDKSKWCMVKRDIDKNMGWKIP